MGDFDVYVAKANPFNDNHLFNQADLDRHKLSLRDKVACIFHPMKVMIQTEGVYYFKTRRGQYYFYRFEPIQNKTNDGGSDGGL